MTVYCECGDVATIYTDIDGDPLPQPLCFDCFFFQTTMQMEHLPDQTLDPDTATLRQIRAIRGKKELTHDPT